MSTLWESWRAEFEALPALAGELEEGAAEEFVRHFQTLVAEKRVRRDSALKLINEIKYVHVFYEDLLVFFDLERDFLRWSVLNCTSEQVDRARSVLAEWREVLQQYSAVFPPPEGKRLTYAAMQMLLEEAHRAATAIFAGFRSLNACLAPQPQPSVEASNDAVARVKAA
jgi:hypothetical protein